MNLIAIFVVILGFLFMNESVGELTRERNEELTDVFLRLLGDGRLARDVISSAVSSPSSRFWISERNALRYVKMRLDGRWGNTGTEHPLVVQRTDVIIERCNGDYSLAKVREVVESPAPCFFLGEQTARNIIYETMRKRKERKRCR